MTRKDVKGDQPSGGETTWTNTGATRYGRGQHKTGLFGDDMLRPSPNHGTQRLPNDDDESHFYLLINIVGQASLEDDQSTICQVSIRRDTHSGYYGRKSHVYTCPYVGRVSIPTTMCLFSWINLPDIANRDISRPGAKTINVFRACLGAQLTTCAQK